MDAAHFFATGWIRFARERAVARWAERARPVARDLVADAAQRARWLRCGGTWFVGANLFPNDSAGAVPGAGVPGLEGGPIRFIADALGLADIGLDRGQLSVCFPGYPQPSADESSAAFRFRRDRDAAHVDGLRRIEGRRRRLGEMHGYILGLPLTDSPPDAAPLVIWEGSHEIIRRALRARLEGVEPERWAAEDLTDSYVAARRECFETCRRVAVAARPGEAYLIHRLALHGVARWGAAAVPERAICYFRPVAFPRAAPDGWLDRP